MSEKKEFKRDNFEETKKGLREINKIIFRNNEDIPDDWTDFEITSSEAKILKEGEDYIEKVLIPNLSTYRKISKEELLKEEKEIKEHSKEKEEAKEENKSVIKGEKTKGKFTEEEMAEMNRVLKEKTRNLKLKTEKEVKDKK